MPLRYLLDEHLRGGGLWQAIQQHNTQSVQPLEAIRVGDSPDLPRGSTDPVILLWAEQHGRILLTLDRHTVPGYLANHLQAGRHSPGVLIVRRRCTLPQVLAALVLAAYARDPAYYQDRIEYIP